MTYYDHEPAYRRIADAGGTGWDDLYADRPTSSYAAIDHFLASQVSSPLPPPPCDAIDLGCGGGQVALRLAARGHRVTGVDFSPTAIALARTNAAGVPITFLEGDCLALALPDASFDLAIDNHVLHCLLGDDRARFLREIHRVLRPGGLLFSDTMSREGDFDPASVSCDPVTFTSTRGNRYWTSGPELDALLAATGFVIESRHRRSNTLHGDSLIRVARR